MSTRRSYLAGVEKVRQLEQQVTDLGDVEALAAEFVEVWDGATPELVITGEPARIERLRAILRELRVAVVARGGVA